MKLALLVIIATIFFVLGYLFVSKKHTKKNSKNLLLGVASLLFLIIGYSMLQNRSESKNIEVLLAYNQNRAITCKDVALTNKEFNYVSGTLSFVGKDSSSYRGLVLSIEDCKIN
jgi:hypothetical protein